MNQILIRILGLTYSFIALPAMAIIAVAYYLKNKTRGGLLFSVGAIAATVGSMFNQLFPLNIFLDESTGALSLTGKTLTSMALIVHLSGFLVMVVAWGIITFGKEKRII
jgi:hypothetical protein